MERKMERYANDLPTVCDCIAPYVSVGSTSDLSSGGAANDCCLLHLGWGFWEPLQIWQYIKMDDSMPFYRIDSHFFQKL